MFFFYVYELRLSATMLLNEYDDHDDDDSHCIYRPTLDAVVEYQTKKMKGCGLTLT